MSDLLPCPFCGSNNVKACMGIGATHTVECEKCETTGPRAMIAENATTTWNIRAALSGALEPGADVDFLRGLVDWVYLTAMDGQSWPSTKTADRLIALAKERRPKQDDATAMKKGCPAQPPAAEQAGPVAWRWKHPNSDNWYTQYRAEDAQVEAHLRELGYEFRALYASAPDVAVKALELQEAAEQFHMNCKECDGDEQPENCEACFPLFDDARIARRTALATIRGGKHE